MWSCNVKYPFRDFKKGKKTGLKATAILPTKNGLLFRAQYALPPMWKCPVLQYSLCFVFGTSPDDTYKSAYTTEPLYKQKVTVSPSARLAIVYLSYWPQFLLWLWPQSVLWFLLLPIRCLLQPSPCYTISPTVTSACQLTLPECRMPTSLFMDYILVRKFSPLLWSS